MGENASAFSLIRRFGKRSFCVGMGGGDRRVLGAQLTHGSIGQIEDLEPHVSRGKMLSAVAAFFDRLNYGFL